MSDRSGVTAQRPGSAVTRWAGGGLRGFCIGLADLVPGVSGSTVAVLLGVYERLLAALRGVALSSARLLRGDPRGAAQQARRIDWALALPVAAGAAVALGALAGAVDWLLRNRPEPTAGAFGGLVCAAVLVAAGQVRSWRVSLGLLTAAVATLGAWLFGLSAAPVAEPATILWLGAGALGICAMILPGISGAFVLLIIGLYASFIDALSDRDWAPLGLFAAGALVGGLLFASLLSRLLTRYHDAVMATLVGLMLGSLRVLWPWPNGVGHLGGTGEAISGTALAWPSRGEVLWPSVCAVAAFALALAASRYANRASAETGH